jgi:hypothetical protein
VAKDDRSCFAQFGQPSTGVSPTTPFESKLNHQFRKLKSSGLAFAANSFAEFKAGLEQHIVWKRKFSFHRLKPSSVIWMAPGGHTFHALAQPEKDVYQHVHQENNALFPKAIAALYNERTRLAYLQLELERLQH